MIALIIQGEVIDIDPAEGIPFERNTPLFNEERIKGSRSEPFNLLDTPHNNRFLKQLKYTNLPSRRYVYDGAQIYYASGVVYRGSIAVRSYKGEYEAIFTVNNVVLKLAKMNLRDFDYGNTIDLGSTPADVASYCQAHYPEDGIAFPTIFNREFYDDDDWGMFVNPKGTPASLVNDSNTGNKYSFAPCFYLKWMLEKIAEETGFTFKGSLFEADWFEHLIIESPVPLDQTTVFSELGTAKFEAETVIEQEENGWWGRNVMGNDKYYEYSKVNGFTGFYASPFDPPAPDHGTRTLSGHFDSSANAYICPATETYGVKFSVSVHMGDGESVDGDKFYRVDLKILRTPQGGSTNVFYIEQKYLTEGQLWGTFSLDYPGEFDVGDSVGFQVEFFGSDDGATYSTVVGQVHAADAKIQIAAPGNTNVYKKELNYNEHLPDITFGKLMNLLHKAFNLKIEPDTLEPVVYFDFTEDIIRNPKMIDITGRVLKQNANPALHAEFPTNEGYRIKWGNDLLKADYAEQGQAPFEEWTIDVTPLLTTYRNSTLYWESVVKALSPVNGEGSGNSYTDVRILYPSPGLSWQLDLKLSGGSNNIFNRLFRFSFRIKYFAPITEFYADLTVDEIKNLDFGTLLFIENQVFLMKKTNNTLSDRVGTTKLEAWLVP